MDLFFSDSLAHSEVVGNEDFKIFTLHNLLFYHLAQSGGLGGEIEVWLRSTVKIQCFQYLVYY